MFAALLALWIQPPSLMVADLDRMAQARDLAGVRTYYGPGVTKLARDPMSVLKTGGAYGTGRLGWHVVEMKTPQEDKTFAVFSTPLTMEDIGERLFEVKDDRLVKYWNELDDQGWSISHHDFHISFKLLTKEVFIHDTLTVRHEGKEPGQLFFRFSPNYRVKAIDDVATHKLVPFSQAGGIVALGAGVGPERKLTFHYSGIVNQPNFGGSITDRYAMLSDEYWYPGIGRQPATYDADVDVQKGWSVIAQGEKVSQKKTATGETWTYHMALPVSYFSLSAGAFHTYEQLVGNLWFRTWSFKMTPEESRWQAYLYAPIISLYEEFAPYPFSGYGAVDQPNYGDGMLEAYSFNTGQEGSYPNEEPHEPSHTWFGGMLNNTYLRSFWNESFAVFCEGYYYRNISIGDPEERRRAFVSIPSVNASYNSAPLADAPADIGPDASSLGYGKGAYVLQMLEDDLGTDKMAEALHRWVTGSKPGSVGEWEGFEKVVGPSYKWFFDQWVRRPGYANFKVADVVFKDGAVEGHLTFTGPAYKIHAQAMLAYADGSRQTETFDTTATPEGDGFKIKIPSKRRPVLLSIDPEMRILRPINADERPFTAADAVRSMKHYRDLNHNDYLANYQAEPGRLAPSDIKNSFLIGHPDTMPALRDLCKRVGFDVKGTMLTYKGTTIDLRLGGAIAVVPMADGGRCAIGLGTTHLSPNLGNAQVVVFDEYGRFLRGETAQKTVGNLTFRL